MVSNKMPIQLLGISMLFGKSRVADGIIAFALGPLALALWASELATGTSDQAAGAPHSAQLLAQQTARETLRAAANRRMTAARKRKRPSLCGLRTWTIACDAMRLLAQVAEEGLEPPTRGL